MDKPDWSEAPEWARYLAQDKGGEWWWFECEPQKQTNQWWLDGHVGRSDKAHKEAWTISLEQRP